MFNKRFLFRFIKQNSFRQTYCQQKFQDLQQLSQELPKESQRQRNYKVALATYKDHNKLLYSSFLEQQQRTAFEWKKKSTQKPTVTLNEIVNDFELPKNWLHDYEFYEEAVDEVGTLNSTHGTADPKIPPSNVPCSGCGAHLHCVNYSIPGFIPREIFKGRTIKELQTIVCQRCHFLKHYNVALDVEVKPETYVETISSIKNQFALALVIVDLLDMPCSIWPGLEDLLGKKRPIFVVGNKVDLLPRDSLKHLEHVKKCLKEHVLANNIDQLNLKYIGLISAKTGYGIEELITELHKIWQYKGDVYMIGCTNVGKSTLFNILLNSDYCRPQASDLIRKATTCPWPGTTLQMLKFPIHRPSDYRIQQRAQRLYAERAERAAEEKLRRDQATNTGSVQMAQLISTIGRTFVQHDDVLDSFALSKGTQPIMSIDERNKAYKVARWCYDTPGVMHPAQITNLLTTEELLKLEPKQMITPRAVRLKMGMSLFLAGLARLDFIECTNFVEFDWIKAFVFSSLDLPIAITQTIDAEQFYNEYLGRAILGVPINNTTTQRLENWPGLLCSNKTLKVEGTNKNDCLSCDIVLSSAGWIGLQLPPDVVCTFKVWTPHARGIYLRKNALIPKAKRLIGKRIRNSMAYHLANPFVFKK